MHINRAWIGVILSACTISYSASPRNLPLDASVLVSKNDLPGWTREISWINETCIGDSLHAEATDKNKFVLNHSVVVCPQASEADNFFKKEYGTINIKPYKVTDFLVKGDSRIPGADDAYGWCEELGFFIGDTKDMSCVIVVRYNKLVSVIRILTNSSLKIYPTQNDLVNFVVARQAKYKSLGA